MLETLKTAANIWTSAFRFMLRSPQLIVLGYAVLFLFEYAVDALDDLSLEDRFINDDAQFAIVAAVIGIPVVALLCAFHLHGMRFAMRFATGSVDAWGPLKWCRRTFDFFLGLALYLGLCFSLMPIVGSLFARLERAWDDEMWTRRMGSDTLGEGSASRMGEVEYAASLFAFLLLALAALYIISRLSLWLPMAAFRRDDQWSLVLAWKHSSSRGLLLMSTLVLFEVVLGGLMIYSEQLPELRDSTKEWIAESGIFGRLVLGNEVVFLVDMLNRMLLPAVMCLIFALRTSVAANILGIKEPGAKGDYFTYKSRAVPTRPSLP